MTQFSALFFLASAVAAFQPGPPGGGEGAERRGPPPEALEVCATLEEGEACSFEGRGGSEEGTCEAPPQGEGELACRPSDAPPPQERPED